MNSRAKNGPSAVTTSIGAHHSPNYVVKKVLHIHARAVNIVEKFSNCYIHNHTYAGMCNYAGLTEPVFQRKNGAGHMRVS